MLRCTPAIRLALALCAILLTLACTEAKPGLYRFALITQGGHRFTPGQTLQGDLVILGGQVEIEDGAQVSGALAMLSGNVEVDGTVNGDVSLLNGTLTLGPTAHIDGALNVGGGALHRAPEATIAGPVRTGGDVQVPNLTPVEPPSLADQVLRALLSILVLALVAYTLVRLLPRPVSRVGRAAAEEPVVAGALGSLIGIVAPSLLVLMAFTILLIPVALLGGLLLLATVIYGWVGLGLAVGRSVAGWLHQETSPDRAAMIGTAILTLLVNILGLAPLLGLMAAALSVAVGLGAVLLTGFGTRVFVPATVDEGR